MRVIHVRMPDATPTLGPKPQVSLFTRLAAVEAELKDLKDLFAGFKVVHDAMLRTATNGAGEPSACWLIRSGASGDG